ncbi:MAG: transporter substrate-binding protein [Rubritepida sp.]|nr:transporter substrate-binding protein [Rubritepida sp.]
MYRRNLFAAGAAALASPAMAQPAGSRVLKFVPQSDLTVIDPVVTTAYVTRNHSLLIYDQLYGYDESLSPTPQMVEGHTLEEDGKRWTFRLREGLRFHDGTPVRGIDCIASIKRWAARDSLGQAMMARLAEMTAPDDRTFVIRLNRPYGPMLDTLAKIGPSALFIMPARIADAVDPFTAIREVVGSGPFRWKEDERVVGARAVYERFAGYRPRESGQIAWSGGPKIAHFDRVEWTVMPDPGTKAAALRNGEIDWWENPPNDLLPLLRRSREIVTKKGNPLGTVGSGIFNCLQPPFDKPAIRRAVLGAMSQADFMTAAAGTEPGSWREGVGIFTQGTPLASDAGMEIITRPRDIERSKRELREAGYNGERVVLMGATDQPELMALGEVANDLLVKLGMNVDYQVADWGTVVQRRASKEPVERGGWSMFHTTWTGLDSLNPLSYQVLRSNGQNAWFGWPDAPRAEELRMAWIDAPDIDRQKAIAAEFQREILQQATYMPTGQYFASTAHRRNITGVLEGIIAFWNVRRV